MSKTGQAAVVRAHCFHVPSASQDPIWTVAQRMCVFMYVESTDKGQTNHSGIFPGGCCFKKMGCLGAFRMGQLIVISED